MLFSHLYLYLSDELERLQMEWIKNEGLCVFVGAGGVSLILGKIKSFDLHNQYKESHENNV